MHMHKRIITAGLTVVSFSMVGGMAYAATQSVSTRPSPQVVIPAGARANDRATTPTVEDRVPGVPTTAVHGGADDRTTTTTARTGTTGTTGTTSVTVTTLAGADDRGRGRSGVDDGVNHDANDDRVVATVPSTSVPGTVVPGTTVPDDRGRHVEPGDDRSGSGSSGPSTPATSVSNSGKGSSGSGPGSGSSGSGKSGSGKSGTDG